MACHLPLFKFALAFVMLSMPIMFLLRYYTNVVEVVQKQLHFDIVSIVFRCSIYRIRRPQTNTKLSTITIRTLIGHVFLIRVLKILLKRLGLKS